MPSSGLPNFSLDIMTSRIAYNNPGRNGAFGLPYHYELLADRQRLDPLRRAISVAAPGRRVLESGAGSGILSILAARAGAEMVYTTEPDRQVARFARNNVARSGYGHKIRIIEKDTRELTIRDIDNSPVDMVIAEHLSTWQVTEAQIPVMNHINKLLAAEGAVRIPESASNRIELAWSQFRFEDVVELRTAYFGFSGIPKPQIFSEPLEVQPVFFNRINPTLVDRSVQILTTRSGIVNSLRLTSPLCIFGDIRFESSDSLMPPVIIPLPDDIEVAAGDSVQVHVTYHCETNWSEVQCESRVVVPAYQEFQITASAYRGDAHYGARSALSEGKCHGD